MTSKSIKKLLIFAKLGAELVEDAENLDCKDVIDMYKITRNDGKHNIYNSKAFKSEFSRTLKKLNHSIWVLLANFKHDEKITLDEYNRMYKKT